MAGGTGVVLNTRGVREQVTDGDCMVGNAQACGVRVGRSGDAQAVELGQILFYRVAQCELALFRQHHDANRGERGLVMDMIWKIVSFFIAWDGQLLHIGHARGVEPHLMLLPWATSVTGSAGDCLPIDERLHPLRNLRKDFLIHAARGVRQG